jgi:hypothetical protein
MPIRRFHERIGDVLAGMTLADLSGRPPRAVTPPSV